MEPTAPRSWTKLALREPVHLSAGKYWLGNHIGGDVAAACWGTPASSGRGVCQYTRQPFAAGPLPLFPAPSGQSACTGSLSVFATFGSGGEQRLLGHEAANIKLEGTPLLTPWILRLLVT